MAQGRFPAGSFSAGGTGGAGNGSRVIVGITSDGLILVGLGRLFRGSGHRYGRTRWGGAVGPHWHYLVPVVGPFVTVS